LANADISPPNLVECPRPT